MPGVYDDARCTPAERVRLGYEAIREGAGDEAFILACGCPLGAVVGVVDAMRIGPDVAPSWTLEPGARPNPGYEAAAPSTRGAYLATVARAFQHRRLWSNDPDCLMLRTTDTALSREAARAWALAVGISGGLALVSDDLALLGPDERALLDQVLLVGRAADAAARAGSTPRGDGLLDPDGPRAFAGPAGRLEIDLDDPRPRFSGV
jgi:alpha-galactosidase